jgi:glucoamylase
MCSILTLSSQPGVLITVLPEPDRPDYLIYWVRDALLAYHAWFIELVLSPQDQNIRALLDDYVHAIVRTQHVVNIAGNTFSGGLDEALFDLKLGVITNPSYRVGSPAAGMFIASHIHSPIFNVHSTFQTGHRSAPYT